MSVKTMELNSTTNLYTLTSSALTTVSDTVVANISVILPVALGLFAIVFSIGFIPKILKKFSR